MTTMAIDRLQQNDKGFVLMVEGGRIDHAHHDGMRPRALEDTLAFDAAIKTALDKTKREDTLIVVTADHSHTMTINGYPKRGNPILGLAVDVDGEVMKGGDGNPYTTLSYANGPGGVFPAACRRPDRSRSRPASAPICLRSIRQVLTFCSSRWCRWHRKPMRAMMSASMPGVRRRIFSAARSKRTTSTTFSRRPLASASKVNHSQGDRRCVAGPFLFQA